MEQLVQVKHPPLPFIYRAIVKVALKDKRLKQASLYHLPFTLYTLPFTRFFLSAWYALRVAVRTFDEVNVVRAFRGTERSVHGFHVEAAIRQLRMTVRTSRTGLLAVLLMACEATQPFVHTDGCPVISGTNFKSGKRRMTLVAKRLARVRTDFDGPRRFAHLGQRKALHRDVLELPPIEERKRRPVYLLPWTCIHRLHGGPDQGRALTVHLVAGQARNCGAAGELRPPEAPGTSTVNGRHQLANSSLEVHAVAAQAVVHQELLPVVLLVQEDFCVSGAVRAGRPFGILLLVAIPAALADLQGVPSF